MRIHQESSQAVDTIGMHRKMLAATFLLIAPLTHAVDLRNVTGMPAYPNLTSAVMDGVYRTDSLGRWCMRFWSDTSDSLSVVEGWYRRNFPGASEIDLSHDAIYKAYPGLSGIKLALGIDYVVVYKTNDQAPTSVDLYRCSPVR